MPILLRIYHEFLGIYRGSMRIGHISQGIYWDYKVGYPHRPKVGLWSSKFCDTFGEAETSSVVRLGGRGAVAMPLQHLRKPKCRGLGRWG
jgi:hypothetical protein